MIDARTYSELHAVLQSLGEDFISKVPADLLEIISTQRDLGYNPVIDQNKPIDQQYLSGVTLALITTFKLQYWCDSPGEQATLLNTIGADAEFMDMIDFGF